MIQPVVVTETARKKFAKAHLDGTAIPKIASMSFGTGGVDENGNVIAPSSSQTTISGQFFSTTDITVAYKDGTLMSLTISGIVDYTDTGALNALLSTVGIWDNNGDLVAIKNFASKIIEDGMSINITFTENF